MFVKLITTLGQVLEVSATRLLRLPGSDDGIYAGELEPGQEAIYQGGGYAVRVTLEPGCPCDCARHGGTTYGCDCCED
jgi:hypothetical protein